MIMLQLSTVVEIHERHTQSLIYISKSAQAGDIFGGYFSWHHGPMLESKDIDWNYTVCPNKKETCFISGISSLPRMI